MRIAIATPSENVWSETFIAAHLSRLRGVELVLSGGELPTLVVKGPALQGQSMLAKLREHAVARMLGTDRQGLLSRRIARELRQARAQVVLAEYGSTAHMLLDACRRADVPLVAHFHGFDAHMEAVIKAKGRYQALFAQARALVVVSRAMEQQLLALGAPREKLVHNCYGIDVERFAAGDPGGSGPHFVAVGRFVDKKAPNLALSAFERLMARVPEARLTMVGQGPLWESCAQRARAPHFEGRVELPGVRTPEQIAELMRGARAFVQHSVRALSGDCEGTPLAVLEAMATGIPVVATRHAGIADVVGHGEHGLLCDEFDVEAMAANMERLARDPGLAAELGRAGRAKVVREYRVEDSIAALQLILERAADGRAVQG